MSAQRSRRRGRPQQQRRREPVHVAPVLDPTWQNPYGPSNEERELNRKAVKQAALRATLPVLLLAGVSFVIALVCLFVVVILGVVLFALAIALGAYGVVRMRSYTNAGTTLVAQLRGEFRVVGSEQQRQRLATIVDRLSATFGLSDVHAQIVSDAGFNACLLPAEDALVLLVTSAMIEEFELIELEGVVAHLMARQRLGLLEREVAAAASSLSRDGARRLAGEAMAYRADEVAAAAIRYPHGLAKALERCANATTPADSFFASERYRATRWIWFDVYADAPASLDSDLDGALVRSRALSEW